MIFSCSQACCDTDKWMTQVTIPRSKKNNVQDLQLTNALVFSPKSLSRQWKMNLSASCPLQMKAIGDQLINGTVFHSCETVITKGIETEIDLGKTTLLAWQGHKTTKEVIYYCYSLKKGYGHFSNYFSYSRLLTFSQIACPLYWPLYKIDSYLHFFLCSLWWNIRQTENKMHLSL